ncbi:hypothetical protein [Cellulophaga sp. L1A9]|uniref:hypothetical protein n=1 Tax=Cellulophaga sp. L1A9 TaxID=2686362 RepID=UPI00131EB8DE|nr:hypothetical protein [Cellulophaga sp. L1A9]
MKTTILSIVLVGFAFQTYAQDMLYRAKIKVEEVPELVVSAVEEDFPDFLIVEYLALPLEYVEGDVYINPNIDSNADYDTFQIVLKEHGKELTATYDSDGNLIKTTEHLKNVALPYAVSKAIAKEYPEWKFEKDSYDMVQLGNSKAKKRYRVILENHGKKIRVHTNAKGKILNHHKRV